MILAQRQNGEIPVVLSEKIEQLNVGGKRRWQQEKPVK